MPVARFLYGMCMAFGLLRDYGYAAKFDPFLSLDCNGVEAGVEGLEIGVKFCHMATLRGNMQK